MTRLGWWLVAAVLVLCVGGGLTYALVNDDRSGGSTSAPGSARPSGEASTSPTPTTQGWREAARSYGVAFTNTTGGHEEWLRRLRPLISPALADSYRWTDVRNLPTGRLRGVTGGTETAGETPTREVELRYSDGLVVDLRVSEDPASGRWVVTTAVPASDLNDPGVGARPPRPSRPSRKDTP